VVGFRVLIDSAADERDKFSFDPECGDRDEAVKRAFEMIGPRLARGGDYHVTVWPIDERRIPTGPVTRLTCTMSWVQVVAHKAARPAARLATSAWWLLTLLALVVAVTARDPYVGASMLGFALGMVCDKATSPRTRA